jgi:predicted transcriptional regulator
MNSFHGAKKTAFPAAVVKRQVRKKQHFACSFSSIWQLVARARGELAVDLAGLSRRERQVMDILYRLGRATAQQVHGELVDAPSYSAVRALLAVLEGKGLVRHSKDSRRYVYQPVVPERRAKRSALRQLIATFFDGRPEKLVASLLDPADQSLSVEEIARIRRLIGG